MASDDAPCWVTAHIIDNEMPAGPGEAYAEVPPSALVEVAPLGVAVVVITRAPAPNGFEPSRQTMVMLEFEPDVFPESAGNRVSGVAVEAIARLQHHNVAPKGLPTEAAKEFGDSLNKTFRDHIE